MQGIWGGRGADQDRGVDCLRLRASRSSWRGRSGALCFKDMSPAGGLDET